jgi:hypothetical protein
MTRMRCQFRRGRTIVSEGRSDDDAGIVCKFMWQRGADLGARCVVRRRRISSKIQRQIEMNYSVRESRLAFSKMRTALFR